MNDLQKKMSLSMVMKVFVVTFVFLATIIGVTSITTLVAQADPNSIEVTISDQRNPQVLSAVFIAGGIAFGLAALGAGIAVGNASSAAIGAISEKPSMFGQALIFIALGEGIMIIGFAMFFIMLGNV